MNQVAGILDLTLDSTRCPVPMHVTACLYSTWCHVTARVPVNELAGSFLIEECTYEGI